MTHSPSIIDKLRAAGRLHEALEAAWGEGEIKASATSAVWCPRHQRNLSTRKDPAGVLQPGFGRFECMGCGIALGLLELGVEKGYASTTSAVAERLEDEVLHGLPRDNGRPQEVGSCGTNKNHEAWLERAQERLQQDDGWRKLAESWGLHPEGLLAAGAGLCDATRGGNANENVGETELAFLIPVCDAAGRRVGLKERRDPGSRPKSKTHGNARDGLLNFHLLAAFPENGRVMLLEGETDAIAVQGQIVEEGLQQSLLALAVPGGASQDVTKFAAPLAKFRIAVIYDVDGPECEEDIDRDNPAKGIIGGHRAVRALRTYVKDVRQVRLPFTEQERAAGANDLRDWLNAGGRSIFDLIDLVESDVPPANDVPDAAADDSGAVGMDVGGAWPQIDRLDDDDDDDAAVPFPVAMLGGVLAEYVSALASTLQAPQDMVALGALATVNAAGAPKFEVEVNEEWREQLNLYCMGLLPVGERKTPVFMAVSAPLREWEQREREAMEPAIREARNHVRVLERALDKAEKDCGRSYDEAAMSAVNARSADLADARRAEPIMPRVFVDNVTPEKLDMLLEAHGGSLAAFSDEGSFIKNIFQYADTPKAETFLKAYDGSPINDDRVGRDGVQVARPCLTMFAAVQPQFFSTLPGDEFRGRGVLARILFAVSNSLVGYRTTDAPPMPVDVKGAYWRLIKRVASLTCKRGENREYCRKVLRLSEEARALLWAFREECEESVRPLGADADIPDWINKAPGRAVRIAGTLHIAHDDGETIHVERMGAGIEITRWGRSHYRRGLGLLHKSNLVRSDAQLIEKWLEAEGWPRSFNASRMWQGYTKGDGTRVTGLRKRLLDDIERRNDALKELQGRNYLRPPDDDKERGRPEKVFFTNPVLREVPF